MNQDLNSKPLAGCTIAVPETRELELFARMLEEQGATVLRCPMLSILDAPDPAPIEAWLRELTAGKFHDLILLTGEGLRRLIGFAERAGIRDTVIQSLSATRKITRGPKPAKALRELNLRADLPSSIPTTEGVIQTLSQENLRGRLVGVQLYGTDPNLPLIEFLTRAGATPRPVAPYIYAPASHDSQVADLIRKISSGALDAVAFTSAGQVKRLLEVAETSKLEPELRAGLKKLKVAAVGPVVAEELRLHSIEPDVIPESSYFLRPLVTSLVDALA